MSILIKGIDMPKNFPQTIVLDTEGKAYRKEGTIWAELQAIQIDRPHGRLGDLDELLASKCDEPNWCVWLNEIDDAPTILEAEE